MIRALKNKKRITKNTEFIENYTRNVISGADHVLAVELNHDQPLTLSASKRFIRQFFDKIRGSFKDSEYLLLTNMDNQVPRHKMLVILNGETSKFQELLQRAWKNSSVEVAERENAEKYAQGFSDFYLDAAESVPFTNQNSKQVKSKLFQKSRISISI
jgi:hypothetical protein